MIGYVYCFTNKNNNKKYIGITTNLKRRIISHKCSASNSYFHRSIEKHGFESFRIEILAMFNDISFQELCIQERSYIDKYRKNGCKLYNLTDGGEGVHGLHKPCSETARLKKSKVIYQYNLDGSFVREWRGIGLASKSLNIKKSCISSVLHNRLKSAGGFMWSFERKDKLNPYTKSVPQMSEENKRKLRLRNSVNKWGAGRINKASTKKIWSVQRIGNKYWRHRK